MQATLNPRIDRALVGQDGMLSDGVYMDQYLARLNDVLPLDDALGAKRARILTGNRDTLTRLLSRVPVNAFGTDYLLNGILYTSAMAEFWQPDMTQLISLKHEGVIKGNNGEAGEDALRKINGTGRVDGYLQSAQLLRQKGLVFPTVCEHYLVLVPSQELIELFAGRKG